MSLHWIFPRRIIAFHPLPLNDAGERVGRGSKQGRRAVGMTVKQRGRRENSESERQKRTEKSVFYIGKIGGGDGDVEMLIRLQLRKLLTEPGMVAQFAERTGFNPLEVMEFFKEEFWNELRPGEYNRLIQLLIAKAVVWEDRLEIELKTAGIKSLMEVIEHE